MREGECRLFYKAGVGGGRSGAEVGRRVLRLATQQRLVRMLMLSASQPNLTCSMEAGATFFRQDAVAGLVLHSAACAAWGHAHG